MAETSSTVVRRYLTDAISLEKDLQGRFEALASTDIDGISQKLFRKLAAAAKVQQQTLESRLEQLGGTVTATRSLVEQIFGFRHKPLSNGHAGRSTMAAQVVQAFAAANGTIALHEVLLAMTEAAGDSDTGTLIQATQKETKLAAENIWQLLPAASWDSGDAALRMKAVSR